MSKLGVLVYKLVHFPRILPAVSHHSGTKIVCGLSLVTLSGPNTSYITRIKDSFSPIFFEKLGKIRQITREYLLFQRSKVTRLILLQWDAFPDDHVRNEDFFLVFRGYRILVQPGRLYQIVILHGVVIVASCRFGLLSWGLADDYSTAVPSAAIIDKIAQNVPRIFLVDLWRLLVIFDGKLRTLTFSALQKKGILVG